MSEIDSWLAAVRSFAEPDVFNPYSSLCPHYDKPNAADVRFAVLARVLNRAIESGVDSIWIGRDLGYRGGRRTGLALTDDVHHHAHLGRWGIQPPESFLKGAAVTERTASVIWGELDRIDEAVFLWNVFPFHPHDAREPMTNRAHSSKERAAGEEILAWLVRLLSPKRLVAVGKDAHRSALHCARHEEVVAIRHPSYGGKVDFIRGVRQLYSMELA